MIFWNWKREWVGIEQGIRDGKSDNNSYVHKINFVLLKNNKYLYLTIDSLYSSMLIKQHLYKANDTTWIYKKENCNPGSELVSAKNENMRNGFATWIYSPHLSLLQTYFYLFFRNSIIVLQRWSMKFRID